MRYIHIYIFVLHNHFIVVAFILRYNILKETEKKKKEKRKFFCSTSSIVIRYMLRFFIRKRYIIILWCVKPCNPKGFIEIPLTLWLTLLKQRFRSSHLCYVIDGIKCKGNASYTLPNSSALKRLKLEAYVPFWKFSTVT